MKKTLIAFVLLGLTLIPALIMAQDDTPVLKKDKIIVVKSDKGVSVQGDSQNMQELKDSMKELKNINKTIQINMTATDSGDESPDAPFFGIIPAELDFPKAQELNYDKTYGVLVTGIVPNSPAYQYRLVEDDIIMEINGKKVMNLKEMDKIKALYRAGDAATLTIFRADEMKNIDFVFGSREKKPDVQVTDEKPARKKLSVGYGGGTWIPMYFNLNMDDVNLLIHGDGTAANHGLGFAELPKKGILTQGGGGKGNVGKGWFLGGQVSGYSLDRKRGDLSDPTFTNQMTYSMTLGGITLDKRFAIAKHITTALGVMVGGASHSITLVHSNGDYYWDEIQGSVYYSNNTTAKISRAYLMVQPRAELLVSILPWLGVRAEGGYVYGYAPASGWKISHNDMENYEISNSPDTKFEGYTISVGPWFGF